MTNNSELLVLCFCDKQRTNRMPYEREKKEMLKPGDTRSPKLILWLINLQ